LPRKKWSSFPPLAELEQYDDHFETLQKDLKRIGALLGIAVPDELPQKKVGYRTDRRAARDISVGRAKANCLRNVP
jgi:hypothetical protein